MVRPTLLRSSAVTLCTRAQTLFFAPAGGGLQTYCQSPYWPLISPPNCWRQGGLLGCARRRRHGQGERSLNPSSQVPLTTTRERSAQERQAGASERARAKRVPGERMGLAMCESETPAVNSGSNRAGALMPDRRAPLPQYRSSRRGKRPKWDPSCRMWCLHIAKRKGRRCDLDSFAAAANRSAA